VIDDRPLIDWAWIAEHLPMIGAATVQHVVIAALAVTAGFAISLGIALWVRRDRRVYGPATAVSGILYTIPSLALFALLVPFTGLSLLTVEIPLVTYTLLILIRGIVAGLDAVPADVREAAVGMGLTGRARLRRVDLPLALPLIFAALRLAAVSTIGLVTVGALIGDAYGGLGVLINEGLQTFFPTEVYVGAIVSIALAFAADFALVRAQRRATPWTRVRDADGRG